MSSKSKMKKPRRLVIGVYLDDELADRADVAQQVYDKVRIELERTRPRRLAEYAAAGLQADEALERVQDEDSTHLVGLAGDLDRAQQALDEATDWFVFQSLGHRRLRALAVQHPPTPEQEAAATGRGEQVHWNEDTFPKALCQLACVSHPRDVWDDVFGADDELDDDGLPPASPWSKADVEALLATAIAANQTLRTAPADRKPPIDSLVLP